MGQIDRRTLLKAGLAVPGGLMLAAAAGGAAPAQAAARVGRTLARDLVVPWGIAFLPSGNALVGERNSGDLFVVRRTGGKRRVGRLPAVNLGGGEGGLLGLALHPGFATNRLVYAYLTSGSDNRIVRFRFADDRVRNREVVLAGIPANVHHNGGALTFGPDGLLYASTGDGEVGSRAQSRSSLGGKVLRLTPDGEVPAGNPFDNYTWSYGHRNVEGLRFDPRGGLWATEFGEKETDELNRIVPGANYGWPNVEGADGGGGYKDPLAQWSPTAVCSPAGLAIARGRAWVGALRGECLYSVRLRGPDAGEKRRHFRGRFGRIRGVAKAPDGSLWITTSNRDGRGAPGADDDRVIRVVLG